MVMSKRLDHFDKGDTLYDADLTHIDKSDFFMIMSHTFGLL